MDINPFLYVSMLLNVGMLALDGSGTDLILSHATGFLYEARGRFFLVTNWHVFSGFDFVAGAYTTQLLDRFLGKPSFITINSRTSGDEILRLWLVDDNEKPLWAKHPSAEVDIAVLPLSNEEATILTRNGWLPINSIPEQCLLVQTMEDVFIIGYPFGKTSSMSETLPIFKRGTIASDPFRDYYEGGKSSFIVDATTTTGMSGSPVIMFKPNGFIDECGVVDISTSTGYRFVGVYSGRLIEDDKNAATNLGLVWKRNLLNEIIESYKTNCVKK